MNHQTYIFQQIGIIDRLLSYLQHCKTPNQRDKIMQEVREIRCKVSEIEEMTKTEKQREIKLIKMTIESQFHKV